MRKIPLPLILMGIIVLVVGVLSLGIMSGFIPLSDVFGSFITFVFTLVFITVLAIIGAVFVGMFISHRVFSTREFTRFEEEMLKMKKDVEDIKDMVEELQEEED